MRAPYLGRLLRRPLGEREGEPEGRALSFEALAVHLAAVGLDDLLRNGEPQAGAPQILGPRHLVEAFEQLVHGIQGDAMAAVLDGEANVVLLRCGRDMD